MRFQDKTAIVTGGSRGIGREIALTLAKDGANIAILQIGDDENAAKTQQEITGLGVKCGVYTCDVSDYDGVKETVDQVIGDFGAVDILINNAGIVRDATLRSMKEQDFDAVINVNLKGAFNMIKHLYTHFMKRRSGRIVNISSVVALGGNAGQANYVSAKAGLIGLTKTVAKELGGRGITCNAVAPGYIETEMTKGLSDKIKENFTALIPMRKPGSVQDVANAVAFLSSDEAAYITGEVLRVDGGMAM